MKRLTRQEIWEIICKKYPSFKALTIEGSFNNSNGYVTRPHLLKILNELGIDKSRHLTKEEKERLSYEKKMTFIKKL